MKSPFRRALGTIALMAISVPVANAQLQGGGHIILSSPGRPATITISEASGAHVKFAFAGVDITDSVDFVLVIPSSGTTPAVVTVGVNPNVALVSSKTYALGLKFTTVDQNPPSTTGALVTYQVPAEPPPSIQSIVNSASLQPVLSPGALVSLFGSHFTGPTLSTTFDDTGSYPTSVRGPSVTFNGIPAPLLYVSPTQINAIVPFSLAGQTSLQAAVQRFDQVSAKFTVPLQDTSPAIFTSDQSGTGAAVILQQASDGSLSYNSASNPAPAGASLEIFATGQGVWTPPSQSDIFFFGESFTTQPAALTIGGQSAKVAYAGTLGAMFSSWSVLQVNAVVPSGLGSGAQPVVLTIGVHDNSQQKVVVFVR